MAKKLAIVFGVVFVLVGLLGFITNPIVGSTGYFHADALHNIVHLLVGVVMLFAASRMAAFIMIVVGAVYGLLAIIGFIQSGPKLLGIIGYNSADNWLHLVLGIVIFSIGMALKDKVSSGTMAQPKM